MTLRTKLRSTLRWLPAYIWQRVVRRPAAGNPLHLIFAVADHFEPSIIPGAGGKAAARDVQESRLEAWCRAYPKAVEAFPDSDGRKFRHTYFYPAEQYDKGLIERLADHCKDGWGEIEIHLHHGISAPDTPENTRRILAKHRDALVGHGCLSRVDGSGPARYAFVHGNWALANSAGGRFCGVDNEMQILAESGCYADFTLPSAPSIAQVSKINSLYECALPLQRRSPHRRGKDLLRGRSPQTFPLVVQGPLMLNFSRRKLGIPFPRIENGELAAANPPTMQRLRLWRQAAIGVRGRSDWIFIKLHCHGMDPRDQEVMHGASMQRFLRELKEIESESGGYRLHFVTARELVNMLLAVCDGCDGNPGSYRDYRLRLIRPQR